jgi:hypothetical protein
MTDHTPGAVKRLLEAANRHDTEGFLATFTGDGIVDDWGREFSGPASIKEWSDREFIGASVRLTVTRITNANRETRVSAEVGGDGYNGPSHFIFHTDGELVARMTIRQ